MLFDTRPYLGYIGIVFSPELQEVLFLLRLAVGCTRMFYELTRSFAL